MDALAAASTVSRDVVCPCASGRWGVSDSETRSYQEPVPHTTSPSRSFACATWDTLLPAASKRLVFKGSLV